MRVVVTSLRCASYRACKQSNPFSKQADASRRPYLNRKLFVDIAVQSIVQDCPLSGPLSDQVVSYYIAQCHKVANKML